MYSWSKNGGKKKEGLWGYFRYVSFKKTKKKPLEKRLRAGGKRDKKGEKKAVNRGPTQIKKTRRGCQWSK